MIDVEMWGKMIAIAKGFTCDVLCEFINDFLEIDEFREIAVFGR